MLLGIGLMVLLLLLGIGEVGAFGEVWCFWGCFGAFGDWADGPCARHGLKTIIELLPCPASEVP